MSWITRKAGYLFTDIQPSLIPIPTVSALALSYPEHLSPTYRADAFSRWLSILHSYRLGILHFSLGSAFHTVCLHLSTSYQLLGLMAPVLQTEQKHPAFKRDVCLFHTLDRLRFYEVGEDEVNRITGLVDEGSTEYVYKITPGRLSVPEWLDFEREHKDEIQTWQKHIREFPELKVKKISGNA